MKKQFLLLASLRFLKMGLNVALLLLYARAFGVGVQMDAWVFAAGVTAAVGMALWGPVNEIVRSRFVRQVAEQGEEGARSAAVSLLVFTAAVSVAVALVLLPCAPQVIDALYAAAGASGGRQIVVTLFIAMLPSIVLGQVLGLATAFMNCYDVIYAPEFMGMAAAALNLACVFILTPWLGIYSLALGYYLGAALSLTVVLHFLWTRHFFGVFAGWRQVLADSRGALVFAAPLFLSFGAGQLNGLLEKYLASLLGVGVMSSVNYAAQIKSTLQAVVTSVLFSLIVPRLTHAASSAGASTFRPILLDAQRVAMSFLLLVLPFIFGVADSLALALFGTSSSAPAALEEVVLLIRLYVAALVPVVLYLVYGVALLAQQQGKAYAAMGVLAQALSAVFCIALFRVSGPTVFPLALLMSHLVAALFMLQRLDVSRRRSLLRDACGFAAGLALACAAVLQIHRSMAGYFVPVWAGFVATAAAYCALAGLALLVWRASRRPTPLQP